MYLINGRMRQVGRDNGRSLGFISDLDTTNIPVGGTNADSITVTGPTGLPVTLPRLNAADAAQGCDLNNLTSCLPSSLDNTTVPVGSTNAGGSVSTSPFTGAPSAAPSASTSSLIPIAIAAGGALLLLMLVAGRR